VSLIYQASIGDGRFLTEAIHFKKSKNFTVGIEIEFQLLDPQNLGLYPKAVEILSDLPKDFRARIKPEFIQSMLEVNTAVCSNIKEAEHDLEHSIKMLEAVASEKNCSIFASSLHPFSSYQDQKLYPDPRYEKILKELQVIGERLITQGLHCHIGLDSGETAIKVFDNIRAFLPMLLALSASSPFWKGKDTGFASFRSKLFDALPRSGIPDTLESWDNYCQLVNLLKNCGIISQPRDIWWDVRPSPDLGTIEVRICDIPARFNQIMALCALIQALVAAIATDSISLFPMHIAVLLNNKWQAARHGLEGVFVDQQRFEKKMMKTMLIRTINAIEHIFDELGSRHYLPVLEKMIYYGPTSELFRKQLQKLGSLKKVIASFQEKFWDNN